MIRSDICKVCSKPFTEETPNCGGAFCYECKKEYYRIKKAESRDRNPLKLSKAVHKSFHEYINKDLMKLLLIIPILLCLSSCDFRTPEEIKSQTLTEIYKAHPDLFNGVPEAPLSGLPALLDEHVKNKGQIERTKNDLKQLQAKEKSLEAQIKQSELDQKRFWLNLLSGISLALFVICSAIALITFLSNPIISKITKYCAGLFLLTASLCFFTSLMLPYLAWIGASIVVLGVISLIIGGISWRNNSKALKEVVSAVQETKNEIPDYRNKFKKFITSGSDKIISNIRSNL